MSQKTFIHVCALSLLGCVLCGCQQPPVIYAPTYMEVQGDYVDPYCGMMFPQAVDAFDRIHVMHFAGPPEGSISATYNCRLQYVPMYVTVYVYSAASVTSSNPPATCIRASEPCVFENHFQLLLSNIGSHYEDVVLLTEEEFVLAQPGLSLTGKHAVFNYKDNLNEFKLDIVSELYLFEHDGWLIKYRVEYPWAVQGQVGPLISQFMTALTIPEAKG